MDIIRCKCCKPTLLIHSQLAGPVTLSLEQIICNKINADSDNKCRIVRNMNRYSNFPNSKIFLENIHYYCNVSSILNTPAFAAVI